MSKGVFFLQGIVALPCASQSTDTLAKHTYTAINTTSNPNPNPSSLIQEYEGKDSTMKPNTTFSVLSADYLKNTLGNANIQNKTHTHTHTHTLTHTEISQATLCTDKTTHYFKGSDAITPAQRHS